MSMPMTRSTAAKVRAIIKGLHATGKTREQILQSLKAEYHGDITKTAVMESTRDLKLHPQALRFSSYIAMQVIGQECEEKGFYVIFIIPMAVGSIEMSMAEIRWYIDRRKDPRILLKIPSQSQAQQDLDDAFIKTKILTEASPPPSGISAQCSWDPELPLQQYLAMVAVGNAEVEGSQSVFRIHQSHRLNYLTRRDVNEIAYMLLCGREIELPELHAAEQCLSKADIVLIPMTELETPSMACPTNVNTRISSAVENDDVLTIRSSSVSPTIAIYPSFCFISRTGYKIKVDLHRIFSTKTQCCKPPGHVLFYDFKLERHNDHQIQTSSESYPLKPRTEHPQPEMFTAVVAWFTPYTQRSDIASKVNADISLQRLTEANSEYEIVLQGRSWVEYILNVYDRRTELIEFLDVYDSIVMDKSSQVHYEIPLFNPAMFESMLRKLDETQIRLCHHHPSFFIYLASLASSFFQVGDYDLAKFVLEERLKDVQNCTGLNSHITLNWLDLLACVYLKISRLEYAIEMTKDIIKRIGDQRPDLRRHAEKLTERVRIWGTQLQYATHGDYGYSDLPIQLPRRAVSEKPQPPGVEVPLLCTQSHQSVRRAVSENPELSSHGVSMPCAQSPQSCNDSGIVEDWSLDTTRPVTPHDYEYSVYENGRGYVYANDEPRCPFPCDWHHAQYVQLLTNRTIDFGPMLDIPSSPGIQVLDLGAGPATWLRIFANSAPLVSICGTEEHPMWLPGNLDPQNLEYIVGRIDVTKADRLYDFVRECLQLPVLGWESLSRVTWDALKPGGTAHFIEPVLPTNLGNSNQNTFMGFTEKLSYGLPSFLTELSIPQFRTAIFTQGFSITDEKIFRIPLWGSDEEQRDIIRKGIEGWALRPILKNNMMTIDDLRDLVADVEKEIHANRLWLEFLVLCVKKPG